MTKLKAVVALSLSVLAGSAMAIEQPMEMSISNNSNFMSNAYVHGQGSSRALAAHQSERIMWSDVVQMCHGNMPPMLQSSDPCSFEVYATNDMVNPKKIDVGTVTMYLSDGHISHVDNKALSYGLKIAALAPGEIELDQFGS